MALFFNPDQKYETSPLDAVADIAWVDPEVRIKFRMKVASYLSHPSIAKEKEIRKILYLWAKNHEKIEMVLKSNPKLISIISH